jgi:GAF domain-containing protein
MISFDDILNSGHSRKEKARRIAEKIRQEKDYPWVGIYDVREDEITLISSAGRSEPVFTSFPRDKGLNGRAVMRRQTIIVNDTSQDEDYLLTFTNTKSEIIVPVFDAKQETIIGTIDTEGETENAFREEDSRFLEACAAAIRPLWASKE